MFIVLDLLAYNREGVYKEIEDQLTQMIVRNYT
jgi:hypothetical protein